MFILCTRSVMAKRSHCDSRPEWVKYYIIMDQLIVTRRWTRWDCFVCHWFSFDWFWREAIMKLSFWWDSGIQQLITGSFAHCSAKWAICAADDESLRQAIIRSRNRKPENGEVEKILHLNPNKAIVAPQLNPTNDTRAPFANKSFAYSDNGNIVSIKTTIKFIIMKFYFVFSCRGGGGGGGAAAANASGNGTVAMRY